MSQAATAPQGAEGAPPKKGKKMLVIIVAAVLLLGGGGGAWWFMRAKHAAEDHEEAKPAPAKAPVFVPLDQFTVNLQPEETERFLQVAMTLKVSDPAVVDAVKLHMPDVRDRKSTRLNSSH